MFWPGWHWNYEPVLQNKFQSDRRANYLSWYDFGTEYIDRAKNVLADTLTQYVEEYRNDRICSGKILALYESIVTTLDELTLPGMNEMKHERAKYSCLANVKFNADVIVIQKGKIWFSIDQVN